MTDGSKFDLGAWEASNDVGYDNLVMAYVESRSDEMPSDASRALKDLARDQLAEHDEEQDGEDTLLS